MDFYSHFQKAFFETWEQAGLPGHEKFLPGYHTLLQQYEDEYEFIKKSPAISTGVDAARLYSVYGFGVAIGKVFAEMLGVPSPLKQHTSDWCGRFNLGISLFDYICDELEGSQSVTSLKVFQAFVQTSNIPNRDLGPAEQLLSDLALSVFNDLKKAENKKEGFQKTDRLFNIMKQLFEAQNFISNETLSDTANLKEIYKALYLKSAAPFRVMAEYTAMIANANNPELVKKARSIGKAIGCCYWLIDDARDVWIDLEAKQWNLFLQLAASTEPSLFSQQPGGFDPGSLLHTWKKYGHANKISRQIIKRLVHAMKQLDISKEVEHRTLGMVSASLWEWYHC